MPTITGCGRDWTALPSDLLAAIASRLTLIDYSTFCEVCQPWACSVADVPPSPHHPYLLLSGSDYDSESSDQFVFFSLPHNTLHRLSVPGLRGKHCIGSQHGWLATLDPLSELALLNPLTSQEILLPSVATLPNVYASRAPDGSVSRYLTLSPSLPWFNFCPLPPNLFRNASFSKVVLSSSPASGGSLTVAALYGWSQLAFARAGEDRWHLYEDEYPDRRYEDVAFRGGRLLALTSQGALLALELDGDYADCKVIVYDPQDEQFGSYRKYLVVDDATGDLLQVRRELGSGDDDRCSTVRTESITVTRLDEERNVWIPVESLGDRALFVGVGSSVLLSGKEVRGLRRNCVYFTDDRWNLRFSEDVKGDRRDVGIYCLEDGSVQPCLPPDDRFNWPPPVWISPSLSQVN
ncbi:putative F-box protein At4g22660 [Ananas comosus]|uniref:F-box protein At4g22660 n=1 Tax=Ananas comosus TaxID=4615 RepID=A0A6P5HAD1_ANACO|nr:putative F-box protein At4g22660 [Ananas comosus]